MVAKELLWLQRNPAHCAGFMLTAALLNGAAMFLVSRASAEEAMGLPGLSLFGVAALLLLPLSVFLELERPALWQWAALPRPISKVFVHKTLFLAGLAATLALPSALYSMRLLPSLGPAVPKLLYGGTCIVVLAVLQSALWLRHVTPTEAPSPVRHLLRALQLSFVASILVVGFGSRITAASILPVLVIVAAFASTFWRGAVDRLLFAFDASVTRPASLTATYALATLVVTRTVQAQLLAAWTRGGMAPSRAAALSIVVSSLAILTPSLLWLRYRGVTGLRERLGLGSGRGVRVILREGLLWSLPAMALNFGYWPLFGRWFAESTQLAPQQPPMMTLLATSALSVVGVGCVAAPLIEELMFRGMLYRSLRSGWGIGLSLLLSTVVFTVDHTLTAAVPIFCAAACMTLAFERSRSLYAAMLTHAVYNGAIACIVLGR